MRANSKIHYHLRFNSDCSRLAAPLPETLFRVVQEGLTNISKHSQASSVDIELAVSDQFIILTLADNGNAELPFAPNSGLGLLGIRERVSALDGQLQLRTRDSGGLILHVKLPIPVNNV